MLDIAFKSAGYEESVPILRDINITVQHGSILALVGESGSGKSTLGLAIVGLVPFVSGTIKYDNDFYSPHSIENLRSKIQYIFQDPFSALNPRMTIGQCYREVLEKYLNGPVLESEIIEVLSIVELGDEVLYKYPHELSGGQCQRANIGRALAMKPEILICDEIVSALDVSVQAKIINVLEHLKKIKNLGILFTTHDLNMVKSFADETVILHDGKIVERGEPNAIFNSPQHPYTAQLVQSAYGLLEDDLVQ